MTVRVLWLFLAVPWVGLQYVTVVFPGNNHLLLFHDPSTVLHTLEVRLGQRTIFADMEYDILFTKAIHMATGLTKRDDVM